VATKFVGESTDVLSLIKVRSLIIGVDEKEMRLIYSVSKCIEILCRDMSEEDALEHFDYNVSGSYMGDKTPIWCYDIFDK